VDELHVYNGEDLLGRYQLHATELVLGRAGHVVLESPNVSRLHAHLGYLPGQGYIVTDLGSKNGTKVNGHPVPEKQSLKPGDVIEIGDFQVRCMFVGAGAAKRAAPPPASREGLADTATLKKIDLAQMKKAAAPARSVHPAVERSASARLMAQMMEASQGKASPAATAAAKPAPAAPAAPGKPAAAAPPGDGASKPEASTPGSPKPPPAPPHKRDSVGVEVRRTYDVYFRKLRRLAREGAFDVSKADARPISADLTYFDRPNRFRRALRRAWILAALAGLAWIGIETGRGNRAVFTSESVSAGHASFGEACEKCHVDRFSLAVRDATCLACHVQLLTRDQLGSLDADPRHASFATHHDNQERTPRCAECHVEHGGHPLLASSVKDRHCVQCHGSLEARSPFAVVSDAGRRILGFAEHPEFAPVLSGTIAALPSGSSGALHAPGGRDPAKIFLDHAAHLAAPLPAMESDDRRAWLAAKGRDRMICTDCHVPDASRKEMQPIRFAESCKPCHALPDVSLTIAEGDRTLTRRQTVPHGIEPRAVLGLLVGLHLEADIEAFYKDYIASHPGDLVPAAPRGPPRGPPGRAAPVAKTRTPEEWVASRLTAWQEQGGLGKIAQKELFSENNGGCLKCHELSGAGLAAVASGSPADAYREAIATSATDDYVAALVKDPQQAPRVEKPGIPDRWLPHSDFNHEKHGVVSCVECHRLAPTSKETADVLLPSVTECQSCHHEGGGVRATCTTCHLYHDRGKERRGQDGRVPRTDLSGDARFRLFGGAR
jgi:hypothetical protein